MSSLHVKKGDKVLVLTQARAGEPEISKVLSTNPSAGTVIVENVHMQKRHKKARSAKESGGILTQPGPIHASNVMVVCPVCDKPTRVGKKEIDGKRVRVCKKCGGVLDVKAGRKADKAEKKPVEKKAKAPKATEADGAAEVKKAPAKKPKAAAVKSEAKPAEAAKSPEQEESKAE